MNHHSDRVRVLEVVELDPFDFRWPENLEHFEGGWGFRVEVDGTTHRVRHGLGGREVYGRERVHTVTWLDGKVQVEGVEADDYPTSGALLSAVRRHDLKLARDHREVPPGYDGFLLVSHRREIDAKWSRNCLAVKIDESDLAGWALHAILRAEQRRRPASERARPVPRPASAESTLTDPPAVNGPAVAGALLAHGEALAASLGGGSARFTPDDRANALIHADPFAFLVAVIADQGIRAERAWAIPQALLDRLGTISPVALADDREALRAAFATPPKLHRFINQVADWVADAAATVATTYGGDAASIWSGRPAAADLRARLERFRGIGQKKAAMAVEILARDLDVPISDLSGSDVAFDVHLRRVFLRTGIADRDDLRHMVAAARILHPAQPGALDNPAWDVGRRWCHASDPDCAACPLISACARHIVRGDRVKGI